jgi:hypothetical protein
LCSTSALRTSSPTTMADAMGPGEQILPR